MNAVDSGDGLNRRDILKTLAAVPALSEALLAQSAHAQSATKVDVLIVGSGPVGATFARMLVEGDPTKKILMVDIGAQFSPLPGTNEKNIYLYNYGEDGLDTLSQRVKSELTVTSRTNNQPWPELLGPNSQPGVPPVKYQINGGNPEQEDWENMPAAASSFNVGGQAAHWTCCTPRPEPVERIPFIDRDEWERLITRAEQLLKTNQVSFTESLRGQVIKDSLSALFDARLPSARRVQMLPLACERRSKTWVQWTGVDTILGPLAEPGKIPLSRFELRPETICRELLVENDRISGATLEHLPSGQRQTMSADIVIVAANSFYTPQLLWKSNIRPRALGHYLNDHPMLFCQVVLKRELLAKIGNLWNAPASSIDPVPDSEKRSDTQCLDSVFVSGASVPLPNSPRRVSIQYYHGQRWDRSSRHHRPSLVHEERNPFCRPHHVFRQIRGHVRDATNYVPLRIERSGSIDYSGRNERYGQGGGSPWRLLAGIRAASVGARKLTSLHGNIPDGPRRKPG